MLSGNMFSTPEADDFALLPTFLTYTYQKTLNYGSMAAVGYHIHQLSAIVASMLLSTFQAVRSEVEVVYNEYDYEYEGQYYRVYTKFAKANIFTVRNFSTCPRVFE